MFGAEGGAERTVKMRVAAAWAKWRGISGLLGMRGMPLRKRVAVYDACIRSVLLYAFETWPLIQSLKTTVRSCDRRMIRHMAGVTLRDRMPSDETVSQMWAHRMF